MQGQFVSYYEGKEFEVKLHEKKPGVLSAELKARLAALRLPSACADLDVAAQQALGMMDGAPPPWLINMQRYGPPPSYPTLRIPGLNAPIPKGTSFGFHPGGWGKPPVDEVRAGLSSVGTLRDLSHHPNAHLRCHPAAGPPTVWRCVWRA